MVRGYDLGLLEWEEELSGSESGCARCEAVPYAYSEFREEPAQVNSTMAEQTRMPNALLQQKVQQHQNAHVQLMRAIGAIGKYVGRRNGVFHFTLPARTPGEVAARLRIDPQMAVSLLDSMRRRNAQLRPGQSGTAELELELGEVPACPGRTAVEVSWWGVRIWLNECHTRDLLDALRVGGGLGTLCSAIAPIPHVKLVCGILAASAGIGGGVINYIDRRGGNKGVVFIRPWIVPPMLPVPAVVWHQ